MSSTGTAKRNACVLKRPATKTTQMPQAKKAINTGLSHRRQAADSNGDALRRLASVCSVNAWAERRVYAQMQAEGWSLTRQQVGQYIHHHKPAECGDTLRRLCVQHGWNRDRIFEQACAQGLFLTHRQIGDEVRRHKAALAQVEKLGPAAQWHADLMYDRQQALGLSLSRAQVRDVARRANPLPDQPCTRKQLRLRQQGRAALLAPLAELAQDRHWNQRCIHAHIAGLGQRVTQREIATLLRCHKDDKTVLGRVCEECGWNRSRVLVANNEQGLGLSCEKIRDCIFRHNEVKRRITSIVQARSSGRDIVHTQAAHRYAPVRQRDVMEFLNGIKPFVEVARPRAAAADEGPQQSENFGLSMAA